MKANHPAIAPSMLYAYAAISEGVPFANGAPNLTVDIPALEDFAKEKQVPIGGKDFKTGQTLMKTVLAPGFKARMLGLNGWFSTNILGNRDGEVLDDPGSFKTKEESKLGALEYILQPKVYPELYGKFTTRSASTTIRRAATTKRAGTTSTSSAGSATRCRSKSISCAAIRFWRRRSFSTSRCSSIWRSAPGMRGIQEWLSFYFKSPMCAPGALPRARPLHPADEAEEHAALDDGRRSHHPPRRRILRLIGASPEIPMV